MKESIWYVRALDRWHDEAKTVHIMPPNGAPRVLCGYQPYAFGGVSLYKVGPLCKRCERSARKKDKAKYA